MSSSSAGDVRVLYSCSTKSEIRRSRFLVGTQTKKLAVGAVLGGNLHEQW